MCHRCSSILASIEKEPQANIVRVQTDCTFPAQGILNINTGKVGYPWESYQHIPPRKMRATAGPYLGSPTARVSQGY